MIDLTKVNKKEFTTDGYVRKVEKPWGYELHWAPDGLGYMGKVLHIKKGCRLSLQIHDAKVESYWLVKGKGGLELENTIGKMEKIAMEPGKGYTCKVGQKHRLYGITDCDIIEASTGEIGTTWRLEDDYKRPDETEELRKQPNRGWQDK